MYNILFFSILNCQKNDSLSLSLYVRQSFYEDEKNISLGKKFRKHELESLKEEEDTRRALAGRKFSRDGIS